MSSATISRGIGHLIRFLEDAVPAVLLAVMTFAVASGVFSRYVLDRPIGFINELATVLFIWVVFLSAAGALRRREHISITLLTDRLHGRTAAAHRVLINLFGLVITVGLGYLGLTFLGEVRRVFYTLGIGWEWAFSALPVGMALMTLHLLNDIVHTLRRREDPR